MYCIAYFSGMLMVAGVKVMIERFTLWFGYS